MSAIFIPFSKLCWALGLSVSLLGEFCLALRLSVFFVELMLGIGFVCFSVSLLGTYVWHCVCLLFVGLMVGIGFVCLLVG